MPSNDYPGVYIEEVPQSSHNIVGVDTSITAFIGRTKSGPTDSPILITSFIEFETNFGGLWDESPMTFAVKDFFDNGGYKAFIIRVDYSQNISADINAIESLVIGDETNQTGIFSLGKTELFNLLCIPPLFKDKDITKNIISAAACYCEKRGAILILDSPLSWTTFQKAVDAMRDASNSLGTDSKNAVIYFPRILKPNPLRNNISETFAPCGAIAGLMAKTDTRRGVWKAHVGIEALLKGVTGLSITISDQENQKLNCLGCNCLRVFSNSGIKVWGARTLRGNISLYSEWKYIPIRRLSLFIEESVYRGTQWVVFEPNDEPMWTKIRSSIDSFMNTLFRDGAFQGSKPKDAYFVKCDSQTTTQNDRANGIVNFSVGYAPLKPCEFTIIRFSQLAGQNG